MTSPQKPNPGSSSGTAATPILGVLMLKTAFPRLPGDVGHPDTWSVPTRYRVVETATVASVVKSGPLPLNRSEEHTSELQSLMRISYAVFCLKKKKTHLTPQDHTYSTLQTRTPHTPNNQTLTHHPTHH